MIWTAGLATLLLGAAVSKGASRNPAQVVLMERTGGVLILLGIGLLGCSLPFLP
jgi:hypothetical protein